MKLGPPLLIVLCVACVPDDAPESLSMGPAALGARGAFGGDSASGLLGARNAVVNATTLMDFFPGAYALSSPTIEACTTANNCVLDCTATNVGGPWQCVDGSGNTVAVTQGTGPDTVTTPWGVALKQVTAAKAPKLTTPSAFESFWTQPHTVVFVGYATTVTSATPFELDQTSGVAGFQMRGNDNGCIWYNSGATPTSRAASFNSGALVPTNGIAVYACRKTGTGGSSVYDSFANGTKTTAAAWAFDPLVPTGGAFWFGRNSGGTVPLDGPYLRARLYNAAISDARVNAISAAYQGGQLLAADGTLLDHTGGASPFYVDSNSQAWPYGNSTAGVNSSGFSIEEHNSSEVGGTGNNWATDGLDASSWTDVGTPTVSTNVVRGPFATWKNTAEADEIVDDDAAAFEGKSAVNSCDNAVDHNVASCYLGQGATGTTKNKARLDWVVTGGGSATPSSCDFTITGDGLSAAGFNLYECPTITSGTVTTLKARILVGNAASDTGSIRVSECQCDRTPHAPEGRTVSATNVARDLAHVPAAAVATWVSAGLRDNGTVTAVFTLGHNVPDDDIDNRDEWLLLDVPELAETQHRFALGYEVSGSFTKQVFFYLSDGSSVNDALLSSTLSNGTFVKGQQYVMRAAWAQCDATHTNRWLYWDTCANASSCQATTLKASSTNCTLKKWTSETLGRGHIGNRFNGIDGLNGRLARLKVTTP